MRQLAAKCACDIGGPSELFPFLAPHGLEAPLQITGKILDLHRNAHTPVPVRHRLVSERMEEFDVFLHVFIDGSVHLWNASATAACRIPDLGASRAGRLNFATSSTTA